MSVWTGLRRLLNRAREEATDAAQVARIKLDIRSLEGRREYLFREIGRKVYEARNDNTPFDDIEPVCAEIDEVADRIREKQSDLASVRSRPHTTDSAAAEPGATSA